MSNDTITDDHIAEFRENGFLRVRGVLDAEETGRFRQAAEHFYEHGTKPKWGGDVFSQQVNVWREDRTIRDLTLHPRTGKLAEKLAGGPLRLWHDQLLVKAPGTSRATEFHQDQPYWPHANSTRPISMWVALVDVPPEKGCMTFIPGSHRKTDLEVQNLRDSRSLFTRDPELEWSERVTVPLRAGDCTFHHGRCAHMANPNTGDGLRVAHVVIWVDAGTTYTGGKHVVTDGLGLTEGGPLEHELFPRVG